MIKTGVFATKEEIDELKYLQNLPVMKIFEPRENIQEVCHKMALKHGLPEISGFYGIKNDGEFLKNDSI